MIMEAIITAAPCNNAQSSNGCYCEGMVTEDNKQKKNTNDIIAG